MGNINSRVEELVKFVAGEDYEAFRSLINSRGRPNKQALRCRRAALFEAFREIAQEKGLRGITSLVSKLLTGSDQDRSTAMYNSVEHYKFSPRHGHDFEMQKRAYYAILKVEASTDFQEDWKLGRQKWNAKQRLKTKVGLMLHTLQYMIPEGPELEARYVHNLLRQLKIQVEKSH